MLIMSSWPMAMNFAHDGGAAGDDFERDLESLAVVRVFPSHVPGSVLIVVKAF